MGIAADTKLIVKHTFLEFVYDSPLNKELPFVHRPIPLSYAVCLTMTQCLPPTLPEEYKMET